MFLQEYLSISSSKYGNNIAVRLLDEELTYGELDERSSQLANFLTQFGFGPGSNIGLYLSKSPNAIVAIFGILKAGAAYVPLDTEAPPERIAFIGDNCSLKAILVDSGSLKFIHKSAHLFPDSQVLISLSSSSPLEKSLPSQWRIFDRQIISQQKKELETSPQVTEDSLAYILYTSGSTGNPKGVMLSHRNATVFVDWAGEVFETNREDVFSSHAPFHFDLSILDIFLSIKSGGTLCLIPPGTSYFADAILNFIQENKISVWYSVPNAIIQWLPFLEELSDKISSIRALIYAGEVFPFRFLNQLTPVLAGKEVYNLYGPTETNVITYHHLAICPSNPLVREVPIGEPCSYADIHIVDESHQVVEQGETGELIVRGASLMAGYWDNKSKTAATIKEVTIYGETHPYYFTGDMVQQTPDGQILYVNRRDNMVKTRGFRVELGEIESVLQKQEMVYQNAVVAIPDEMIGHRIIAYYSTIDNQEVDNEDVFEFCAENLPTYMLPAEIHRMESLPRNTRGKIDRELLKSITIKNQ